MTYEAPDSDPINAKPWRGPESPARVLAIRLQAVGDTVLTLPYLQALRRVLPDATLDFLTRREMADIPKSVALFDHVFEIGGGRSARLQLLSALALVPCLWAQRYELVLDLQRNRISRTVRALLRPAAWSEFDRFSPRLAGERTRSTIEAVQLGSLRVYPDLALRQSHAGVEKLRAAGWDDASELVVLNPAGAFPDRSWPLASYAAFAELWLAESARATQFLMLGLPELAPKTRFLKERLGDRLLSLVGQTSPGEAFALVRRAALVLAEDSGLMHMAWVSGAPTLALFGASRSAWSRPHGSYSDCLSACGQPDGTCMDGTCREARPACLDRLPVERVVQRASVLVRRAEGARKVIYEDGRLYAPPLDP